MNLIDMYWLSYSSPGASRASIAVTTQDLHHQTSHKQYKSSYTFRCCFSPDDILQLIEAKTN